MSSFFATILSCLFIKSYSSLLECNQVVGSPTNDPNTPSIAWCASDQTLLSCGISGTQSLWGTYIDPLYPNECIANTDSTSSSVAAVAVCCTLPSGAIKSITTITSADQQKLQVLTQCPSDSVLTGCQVNRESGTIDQIRGIYSGQQQPSGSTPSQSRSSPISTKNQCTAEVRQSGTKLRGGAQCMQLDFKYTLECVATGQYSNQNSFNGQCPVDYQLVSCMTWAQTSALEQWHYTASGGCSVQQGTGTYHHANAICCKLTCSGGSVLSQDGTRCKCKKGFRDDGVTCKRKRRP